jgi:biotin transport system substrate-specific component
MFKRKNFMQSAVMKIEENKFVKNLVEVMFAALFLVLISKISIPLFFTPIPLVLQNSICLFYLLILGRKKSLYSIFLGTIIFPFLVDKSFGFTVLFGISGGYIFGYFIAVSLVAKLYEMKKTSASVSLLMGHFVILLIGTLWMSVYVGLQKAFLLGFLPFLFTDLLKSIVLTKIYLSSQFHQSESSS